LAPVFITPHVGSPLTIHFNATKLAKATASSHPFHEEEEEEEDREDRVTAGFLIGGSVGAIILVCLVLGVFLYMRTRRMDGSG
jgi:hypothetical protein